MSDIPPDATRLADLAAAYDFDAEARDQRQLNWRADLLDRWTGGIPLGARIIELGAGTGQAAQHVADKGYEVVAVDLSPENVGRCRERGLSAVVGDMANLSAIDDEALASPFDAAYAINSLIHFPKAQLEPALSSIRSVLTPDAQLMFTLWGGRSSEEHWEEDWTEPKRFFSFYEEDEAREIMASGIAGFEMVAFSTLDNRDALNLYSLVIELRAS